MSQILLINKSFDNEFKIIMVYHTQKDLKVVKKLKEKNQKMIQQFRSEYIDLNVSKGFLNQLTQNFTGKVKKKTFQDGSLYEGQTNIDGTRNGKGMMTFKTGDIYIGDWSNDLFNGQGSYIFHSQERYEGELKDGMKQGNGKFFYSNGNVYEGGWLKDLKHGKGKIFFEN